jgi:uracil-DNA glycosylase
MPRTHELKIITEARACTLCAEHLPNAPRPLLQGSRRSCLLIIGQAPGQRAHDSGTPWDDASGRRLRDWLQLTAEQFYDPGLVALMPMGFCYPGKGPKNAGDLPPRPECAPHWHPRLIKAMPGIRLTVLIGQYALARYLPDRYQTTTDAVRDYKALLKDNIIALPHPSPRNNIWLKKNPWFERDVLPVIQRFTRRLFE